MKPERTPVRVNLICLPLPETLYGTNMNPFYSLIHKVVRRKVTLSCRESLIFTAPSLERSVTIKQNR